MRKKEFPIFGYIGLIIIVVGEIFLFYRIRPVTWFFTPFMWTGYILMMDGIVLVRRGRSLLTSRTGEFLVMLPLSIVCWLVFEAYNIHIRNWHYEGLPRQLWVRWLGYGWSFATIFPGIFETTDLLESFGMNRWLRGKGKTVSKVVLIFLVVVGAVFLIFPLLLQWTTAQYLMAFVWVGFILLLDPINYWIGAPSLLRDWEEGQPTKLFTLMLAGLVCGFLWEFWNFWAETRWIYDVPIAQNLKVFEMVLPGYLGFLPFSVECYVMYHFCLRILFGIRTR